MRDNPFASDFVVIVRLGLVLTALMKIAKIRSRSSNSFSFATNLFGHPMFDDGKQQRKLELTRSINRLVVRLCFGAAIIAGACLIAFRISGHLSSDEYSNTRILIQLITIGVAFPVCLTIAFRLTATPGSQIWFERLGALILFVFFPIMILIAIFQW